MRTGAKRTLGSRGSDLTLRPLEEALAPQFPIHISVKLGNAERGFFDVQSLWCRLCSKLPAAL